MLVQMTTEAADFIRSHGGRLFVWAHERACCGGTRFIRSSTEPPPRTSGLLSLVLVDGVGLHVRGVGGRLPDQLDIELKGRLRPRVEAYWNGCAFLV